MILEQIMKYKKFMVIGSTDNPEKYAYKIKEKLISKGYEVYWVNKDISVESITNETDIIDLCINLVLGIKILKQYKDLKKVKCVLIQPGAESEEIKDFLNTENIVFLEGCALVGLSLYSN